MIIFYFGADAWRVRQQATAMQERYRAKYSSGINLIAYNFADVPVCQMRDAIRNVSFFDEVRLCVATNCFSNKETADDICALIDDFKLMESKDNVLMITEYAPGPELAKRHAALFKFLTTAKITRQEFAPLRGAALERWVAQECAHRQRTITAPAVRMLIERIGSDSWSLINEITKLANASTTTIGPEAVNALVRASLDESIFALTDALAENNRPRAMALLYQHLTAGADPQAIFGAMVYQMRMLVAARHAGAIPAEGLAKMLVVHPFVAKKALHNARHHTSTSLTRLWQELATIDVTTKRGIGTLEDELFRWILSPEILRAS
ncbi:MAG: DNA polymerase III subunit delta [Patescibacteria group bacterium]